MKNTRKDTWTTEEDMLLKDTVIRYILDGKTQLKAFNDAGTKLSRTPSACGFRWNSTLRKQYQKDIERAKEKKNCQKAKETGRKEVEIPQKSKDISLSEVIQYLQFIEKNGYEPNGVKVMRIEQQLEAEKKEKKTLLVQLANLSGQIKEIEQSLKV